MDRSIFPIQEHAIEELEALRLQYASSVLTANSDYVCYLPLLYPPQRWELSWRMGTRRNFHRVFKEGNTNMLLKTRVRQYPPEHMESIKREMLLGRLAQNVNQDQQYLTGDFVLVDSIELYLQTVQEIGRIFNVEFEVVVG